MHHGGIDLRGNGKLAFNEVWHNHPLSFMFHRSSRWINTKTSYRNLQPQWACTQTASSEAAASLNDMDILDIWLQYCFYIARYWPWNLLLQQQSPKQEYREQCSKSHCDIIVVISDKTTSSWVFFSWYFHIWYPNEHIQNILKFSKWTSFWGPGELLFGNCTGSFLQHRDSPSDSLHFELLTDILAQILTELWKF